MSYEFDGEKYKKASSHQKEWGSRILSELKLSGAESILDLGCGGGFLTQKLSGLVPDGFALGIDASQGMIETAKKSESSNLSFRLEDINNIQFNNEFDVIFSNATLHWIKDHEKLLVNCFKALRNKGYIRFNFAGQGNCSFFYKVIKEVMAMKEYQNILRILNGRGICPILMIIKNLLQIRALKIFKYGKKTQIEIFRIRNH